jgi:hypothetical protein
MIWILNFAVIVCILIIADRKRRELVFEFEHRIRTAKELGHIEGVRTVAQGLIEDEDVLGEVMEWLHNHKMGKARENDAARIHSKILEKLKKQARLIPIGEFGEVVNFDPRIHKTLDNLRPGERVIIDEPGWRVASDIIKMPIVRKKS